MSLLSTLLTKLGFSAPTGAPKRAHKHQNEAVSKRSMVRKRQRMQDAFNASEGMISPRPCTLLEMTPLGGSVQIWDQSVKAALLTGEVLLFLPSDRKEVACAVMWRRDNSLGLKFLSPFREPTRSYR